MNLASYPQGNRRKAVWGLKLAVLLLLTLGSAPTAFAAGQHSRRPPPNAKPAAPSSRVKAYKLDDELTERSTRTGLAEKTRVIVTLVPGAQLPPEFQQFSKGRLDILKGHVLELSNGQLKKLAAHPNVFRVHFDRPVNPHNYRTSVTVGASAVRETMGYTGAGIGIAVIDSGIATFHDDLTPNSSATFYPYGQQRVTKFVDFVNGQGLPYDDNGHGSHVAGIIAGNGYDSRGQKSGIAPDASLVSLKVLDAHGQGTISNIIAALGWVAQNAATYKIRVVNLSVGATVRESYWTDPLTLACKVLVDRGIIVVAAAGNLGKSVQGLPQWGAIAAPGNAPWVLTVGASSTMGTLTRTDDTMASFSSRGPTFLDFGAKPDLVAPGTGTISLAVPGSTFYTTKAPYLLKGSLNPGYLPYLSLSGTSMAAPVVSGTVALMLQANPNLTPNLAKAILQYTAQIYPGYKALEEGAGFLNTLGAVRLARFMRTARPGDRVPVQRVWSRRIIWGNHMLKGGYLAPRGNAWLTGVTWGAAKLDDGENVVWGNECPDTTCDNVVWGTADGDGGDSIVWGAECADVACDNIVWGNSADGEENIVWGNDCGGADCDNIVWGAADADNIVWGNADAGDNIVWGNSGDLNAVWSTSTDADVPVVFPDEADGLPPPDIAQELGDVETTTGVTIGDPTTTTDPTTGVTTTTTTTTTVTRSTNLTTSTTTTTTSVTTTTTVTDPTTGVTTTTTTTTTPTGGI